VVRFAPALFVVLLVGCGPVQSQTLIIDAAAEIAAAKTAQAEDHAPFEYTAAEAYLHKAREEQSYADYEIAVDYARKSRACARVARMIAEAKTKEAMGATRPTHTTRSKCRPGPQREIPLPDAQDEVMVQKRAPAESKKKAKAKAKPQKKTDRPVAPIVPKEEGEPADPLPEGDPDETGGGS
jgi:hypothetical protein